MKRYFWRIMENRYMVWGARILAGYTVVVSWLVLMGSQF